MDKETRELIIETSMFLRKHDHKMAAAELLHHVNKYDSQETQRDREQTPVNDKNRIPY